MSARKKNTSDNRPFFCTTVTVAPVNTTTHSASCWPPKWRCNICNVEQFDDCDKAMEHELQCSGTALVPTTKTTAPAMTAKQENLDAEVLDQHSGRSLVAGPDLDSASPMTKAKVKSEDTHLRSLIKLSQENKAASSIKSNSDDSQSADCVTSVITEIAQETGSKSLLAAGVDATSSPFKEQVPETQQLCSVLCPEGYDKEIFAELPVEIQREEVSKSNPAGMQRKIMSRSRNKLKRRHGEEGRLSDHLNSGVHYHAPSVDGNREPPIASRQRLAKQLSVAHVTTRSSNSRQRPSDRPTHYCHDCFVPECVSMVASELKSELVQQFSGSGGATAVPSKKLLRSWMQVEPGYYRAHLSDNSSLRLKSLSFLPACFQIKANAAQKSTMFLNTEDSQCECHFDRGSSLLFLVSGRKQVKVAPPLLSLSLSSYCPADGILEKLDPFSPKKK